MANAVVITDSVIDFSLYKTINIENVSYMVILWPVFRPFFFTFDKLIDKVLVIHNNDVIMSAMASQITSISIVYSIVYSGADPAQRASNAEKVSIWWSHHVSFHNVQCWHV